MKNILIPTDFSDNAHFAINYGAAIAEKMNASITLLYAFDIPIVADQAYFEPETLATWEKDFTKTLHDLAANLVGKYPELKVNTLARYGLPQQVILDESAGFDLIVIGSKGYGNIGEAVFGNVTSDVVQRSKRSVLVVPPHVHYQPVKNIVLACNDEALISERVVSVIKEYINAFHAKLELLNIVTEVAGPVTEAYNMVDKIKSRFENVESSVNVVAANKVINGINDFSDQVHAGLIAVVPDKHSVFERLFTEIHTMHIIKTTHRAVLVIPGA